MTIEFVNNTLSESIRNSSVLESKTLSCVSASKSIVHATDWRLGDDIQQKKMRARNWNMVSVDFCTALHRGAAFCNDARQDWLTLVWSQDLDKHSLSLVAKRGSIVSKQRMNWIMKVLVLSNRYFLNNDTCMGALQIQHPDLIKAGVVLCNLLQYSPYFLQVYHIMCTASHLSNVCFRGRFINRWKIVHCTSCLSHQLLCHLLRFSSEYM